MRNETTIRTDATGDQLLISTECGDVLVAVFLDGDAEPGTVHSVTEAAGDATVRTLGHDVARGGDDAAV